MSALDLIIEHLREQSNMDPWVAACSNLSCIGLPENEMRYRRQSISCFFGRIYPKILFVLNDVQSGKRTRSCDGSRQAGRAILPIKQQLQDCMHMSSDHLCSHKTSSMMDDQVLAVILKGCMSNEQ
jgi:hypothetical protein